MTLAPRAVRRAAPLLALAGALSAWPLSLSEVRADTPRTERIRFQTNVPASSIKPVGIEALLYLPAGTPPFSAVVITPSSGGEKVDREHHYAQELAREGIAGLVVESFRSRNLKSSVRDQSVLSSWETANDAIGAFRWLVADGRFRPDRIGVTGVSKGGAVALRSAFAAHRRWTRSEDLAFAAHAPIAPPCNAMPRSLATTGKPIFFMLAEHDDQTPAAPCVNLAEALRAAGHPAVSVKIYEGAHHAWEALGSQPSFDPLAQNFAGCRGIVEEDGSLTTPEGERIPGRLVYERQLRGCMRLGTHCCGGTAKLKAEATRDLVAFFKRSGF